MHYVVSEMARKRKPRKCTGKNCSETQALGYAESGYSGVISLAGAGNTTDISQDHHALM